MNSPMDSLPLVEDDFKYENPRFALAMPRIFYALELLYKITEEFLGFPLLS